MGLLQYLLKSVGRFSVFSVVCGLVSSVMKYHNLGGGVHAGCSCLFSKLVYLSGRV